MYDSFLVLFSPSSRYQFTGLLFLSEFPFFSPFVVRLFQSFLCLCSCHSVVVAAVVPTLYSAPSSSFSPHHCNRAATTTIFFLRHNSNSSNAYLSRSFYPPSSFCFCIGTPQLVSCWLVGWCVVLCVVLCITTSFKNR